MKPKTVTIFGLANLLWLAGCGGSQPQPTMMGGMGGMDPLASNGSLGTGAAKGNIAKKQPDLGIDGNLNGYKVFDDGSFWNKDIEKAAVDPNSTKLIEAIGKDKPLVAAFGSMGPDKMPFGIPYTVVSSDAPRVQVDFADAKGSDAGPYPFPLQMPIEKGAAAHAIVIDRDQQKLYEATGAKVDGTGFKADSGAVWDLRTFTARKSTQTSADPSGLPVFPGLVRFEEATDPKGINHVLRFTVAKVSDTFVAPATHGFTPPKTVEPAPKNPLIAAAPAAAPAKPTDPSQLPPMGLHLRLKKTVNVQKFPTTVQPILTALKKYGMVLSDTGTDMGLSGSPDTKWIDGDLASLKNLKASDFEVVTPPVAPKKKADSTSTTTVPPGNPLGK